MNYTLNTKKIKQSIYMSSIVKMYDASNNDVYPVTHLRAVRDSNGTTLESMIQGINETTVGYYECTTAGSTSEKIITIDSSVSLSVRLSCKVKFTEKNTGANATMNINNTGSKPLFYNGIRAAANNSWYPNEIVDLYFDGTNYQAKSCADTLEYDVSLHQTHEITEVTTTTRTVVYNGDVTTGWETETSVSDSSVDGYTRTETNTGKDSDNTTVEGPTANYDSAANKTNVVYVTKRTLTHVVNDYTFDEAVNAIPMSYRHGGLKLRFISNSDGSGGKYVCYFLKKSDWSNSIVDWEKTNLEDEVKELESDVNGINFSPVEVSGFSPWGNNLILALDGYTMVYIPVKAGETFHLEASCASFVRIGFTTQIPVGNTPTTGYDYFDIISKDYTPDTNGYFCMGADAEITYEFSGINPSLRQRVGALEDKNEILDELGGTTIDMADINVLSGAYNSIGVLSWETDGFYHSEPINVTKGSVFKGLRLKTTESMALLASVSKDGTWISNLLIGSSTSPNDFEFIFASDGYVSICGYDNQNKVKGIATIVTKGAVEKINEIENEIETIPPFYIKDSANLVNGAIFTKKGRWKFDKTWLEDNDFRTSKKILVDSTKSLNIGGNINYISISQFYNVNSEEPLIFNDYTSLPAILTLGAGVKAIEISVNDYNVGTAYVGYTAFSEYTRGFAPTIDISGSSISAIPAKLFDFPNTWKGKKYLSLGDSVSARNHWQRIVNFYLGTTHVNKAISGTSIGTYAFNREGGGESSSEMDQAVATSLIPASELQSMDLIIIASYINSALSLHSQAELGSMDDTFISISEEDASTASSINDYATSIALQNFTQAARSTIEYVLKNCGKAKVLIVGDLQFAGDDNYGATNFEWTNNKGYNRRDFAKRMGEIAAYYGLPYVNLEECGGVNALNASEYYKDNIHPNFLEYFGGDDWTECGMKHEAMPIIKAMIGM